MTSAGEILDSVAVHALLAHRHPFLLVDRITIVEPAQRVVGTKRISHDEWWSEGVGQGGGFFPFGLVIEALAQTSGALVRDLVDAEGAVAYFMGADRVRLRRRALPGDELRLDLTLLRWRRGLCRTRGVATVDGQLVASAELTTIVRGGTA